jgi:hypothetical protein
MRTHFLGQLRLVVATQLQQNGEKIEKLNFMTKCNEGVKKMLDVPLVTVRRQSHNFIA